MKSVYRDGKLYAVWQNAREWGGTEVFFRRSTWADSMSVTSRSSFRWGLALEP
jgi:hypothetical protein